MKPSSPPAPWLPAVTGLLRSSYEFGRTLSDPAGRMRDPYETEYGENFAPACFSVMAAALHRLNGQPEELEWALRWGRRSAAIMRESPYLRDYVLGYAAMIFALLEPSRELELLRQEFVAASQPEEPLSPLAHILALQLVGDLLCPHGPAAEDRAEKIVGALEQLWTPAGFPEDRTERDDGSIPHAYLTVATLGIFLLARPATEPAKKLQPRIEQLIARAGDWFHRANGPAMVAVQSNRSYNQLWVYPLYALLDFAHRGSRASAAVDRCVAIVQRATGSMRRSNFLPTELSPYASGGNEPYNRVNNDVGAGGVGWALLALLSAAHCKGLATTLPAPAPVFVDAAAGYACFHGSTSGLVLVTKQHRWRYHYPLQPAWVVVDGAETPFIGAKRSGINNPYAGALSAPARISPLLEPYFGVLATEQGGVHHVMAEPVAESPGHVFTATLRPEGAAPTEASAARVSVQVTTKGSVIELTYHLIGEKPGDLWLSVPVLLWDGTHELDYHIEAATADLIWRERRYALTAHAVDRHSRGPDSLGGLAGPWILRRERFLHTGFGVTGNLAIALGPARAVRVRLEGRGE